MPAASLPDPVDWDWTRCGWGIASREEYLALHARAVANGLFRSSSRYLASPTGCGGSLTPVCGSG